MKRLAAMQLYTVKSREAARDFDDVSGLVSFAAMWDGTQIRAIGLNQQTIAWDLLRHRPQFISLLEGDDTRKRDQEPEFNRALRQLHAAAEAMKDASAVGARVSAFQNFDGFRLGLACVNHDRQIALTRRV